MSLPYQIFLSSSPDHPSSSFFSLSPPFLFPGHLYFQPSNSNKACTLFKTCDRDGIICREISEALEVRKLSVP
ncbi:hypothetical protein QN277_014246 [Acacia crassicarpa]|uniref:Uncharacterized protein n=1 Tax=Acacia crassicarpa TaxID=499986 RepID=A0AAE1TF14_9FABA|nr:hypothetical protein QN277_014246 [Acacia crassicarpa]